MASAVQTDLFIEDLLPGFSRVPDFISVEEEQGLIQIFRSMDWQFVKMHGVVAKRRVAHFGLDYAYERRSPTQRIPIPDFLQPFIERAAAQLKIPGQQLEEILVSWYPPGAGIGWHRDAEAFGDAILGFSLGTPCVMKFRPAKGNASKVYKAELNPRDGYIISGPARWDWHHSIAPLKSERFSVTFRSLKPPQP